MIGSAIALIGSIGGAIYYVEDHFLTHRTGLSQEEAERVFTKKAELTLAQQQTQQYLLELRIEQAEQRKNDYEEREQRRALSTQEQRRLDDANKELERLYDLKEQQR